MFGEFKGAWQLLRLALRRDRIKIGLWLVIILGTILAVVPAVKEMYAEPAARQQYAATMSDSMIGRLYGGVLDGDSLGAVVMVESYAFTATLIAFMAGFMVIRHTRANEESGSLEILQSANVGRYASLTAAVLLAATVSVVIGVITGIFFSLFDDFDGRSGWLLGAAFAGVGVSFAAIAAVCAQIVSTSRGANALVGAIIGLAFILRGIGDALAATINGQVYSAWPAWLSPLGWGQQVYPFTRQEAWVLLIYIVFSLAMLILAYRLLIKRDLGAGILGVRSGSSRASRYLGSSVGLAWRMQRASIAWWTIILLFMGVLYGSMVQEFKDMLSSSEFMKSYITALGGEGEAVQAFLIAMIGITSVVAAGYVVSATLRVRTEESAGRLEPLLATATSRIGWLMAHIGLVLLGTALMLIVLGASTAVTATIVTGDNFSVVDYVMSALAYWPALAACLGVAVLTLGAIPSLAYVIGWGLFLFALMISQLGALLQLPNWLQGMSPFYHVPAVPSESYDLQVLLVLLIIAFVTTIIGVVGYRKRDVVG